MEEIVKKLVARSAKPASGSVPGGLQPHQDRELRAAIEAESLEGMKKRAIVTLEQPEGSTFSIICDEGVSSWRGYRSNPARLLQCWHRLLNAYPAVPVRDNHQA